MKSRGRTQGIVCLTGDADLVGEFARVLTDAEFGAVELSLPGAKGTRPSPGVRRAPGVPRGAVAAVELTCDDIDLKKKRLVRLDRSLPPAVPVISSSVTVTAGTQAAWLRHPGRLVGFGAFPTLLERPHAEISFPPQSAGHIPATVRDFFGALGREVSVVQDRVGMVMPRILCTIINEACFALTEEVASPRDIDTAMKLGTNYPKGPVEWAHLAGISRVVGVLEALRRETGEERYRVAPLLKQMASTPGLLK